MPVTGTGVAPCGMVVWFTVVIWATKGGPGILVEVRVVEIDQVLFPGPDYTLRAERGPRLSSAGGAKGPPVAGGLLVPRTLAAASECLSAR